MGPGTLIDIGAPTERGLFPGDHALYIKRYYWPIYVAHVYEALNTLGVPIVPREMDGFILDWRFRDETVRTLVCYSDKSWEIPSIPLGVRAIFKMRFHPTRHKVESPVPVFAGGFGMGIPYDVRQISELRAIRDVHQPSGACLLYSTMTFRTLHPPGDMEYPNRERFRHSMQDVLGPAPDPYQFGEWLQSAARFQAVLNLCGSGNSIDSKVAQLCAIGCAIVSDRGLETLELPWGERFVHGENVWFIDDPEDLPGALEAIGTGDSWRQLVRGSRRIFDVCFRPDSLGRWYRHCAESLLQP